MYKKILSIICMVLIFTLLFNYLGETKVKAEAITLSIIGGIVFGAIAIAAGYTILKKADLNSLYEGYMQFKGNMLNFEDFATAIFSTSIVTGKYVFDKTSEHVQSVIEYLSSLNLGDGYNKVNTKPNSLPYYNKTRVKDVKFKAESNGINVNNPLFILSNGLVIGVERSINWLYFTVNETRINSGYSYGSARGLYTGSSIDYNVVFDYLNIDIVTDAYGQVMELIISYSVNYLIDNSYNGTELEWKKRTELNRTIPVTDYMRNYIKNKNIQYPEYADIYASEKAIHNGHPISADLKNPTLGLSVSEGIVQKHEDTYVYNGDIEAFVNDLAEAGVLDKVLEWQLGKTREAFVPLPTVIPEIDTETGTISWPATDVIDPSIPDVGNPDIPIVWSDLFKKGTKTLDFSPFMEIGLSERFPFCIPFDLIRSIETLKAPPEAPKWVANIKGVELEIDFSQFEHLASIVRWFMTLLFIVILIMISRRMIGGE